LIKFDINFCKPSFGLRISLYALVAERAWQVLKAAGAVVVHLLQAVFSIFIKFLQLHKVA